MREEYELLDQDFDSRGKRLNEMIPALRALWRGGWVSWSGQYYEVPEMMIEPHPEVPVPILCGGESDAALRRAARLCDGWVGYAYAWDDAVRYVEKLHALRGEYGRENDPFDILLALLEPPTPDLYKRAEDVGITQVMSVPWMGMDLPPGDVERYREPIERFAETIIDKVR
jgi:Luciferase-like monooxygenase